ncbi:MAG: hypothetical protein ACKVOB_11315 [Sphingomonas sp.]
MLITMLMAQALPVAAEHSQPPAQAAANSTTPASTSAPAAPRWSILAPVPEAPCREVPSGPDIVVCASALPSQKLPYPELAQPARPQPSNPHLTGIGALRATDAAVARSAGTSITGSRGSGLPLLGLAVFGLTQAAKGIKKLTTHVDKSKRVAIDLSDPAPPGAIAPPAPAAPTVEPPAALVRSPQ